MVNSHDPKHNLLIIEAAEQCTNIALKEILKNVISALSNNEVQKNNFKKLLQEYYGVKL